jgi:hypothetical protein
VTDELTAITRSVAEFRNALERSDLDFLPTLADFPKGSCGDASLLLGQFLRDSGFGEFDYVCGEMFDDGRMLTHAWLQRGGLIIDITADQFHDIDSPVLITDDHTWHDQFVSEVKHVAGLDIYDDHSRSSLARAYKTVLSKIGAIQQIGPERE